MLFPRISKPWRRRFHMIAMAHPDIETGRQTREKRGVAGKVQLGGSVFPPAGWFDRAAKIAGDQLHAIADAEHRQSRFPDPVRQLRSAFFVDAGWSARENQPFWLKRLYAVPRDIEGHKLAVDIGFPHPAGNQLAVLGAKIEHDHRIDRFLGVVTAAGGPSRREGDRQLARCLQSGRLLPE